MRFSITALFAFATTVLAQTEGFNVITKPVKGEQVPAGSTYEIVWQPSAAHPGEITIGLLGGSSPQTLSVVDTIAKGVDGEDGSYSWSVPSSLGDLATYGIMITLESDASVFQYGFPFQIVADDSGSATSAEATATPTATATDDDSETSTTSSKASTKTANTKSVTSTTFSVPSSTIVSSTIHGNLSTTVSPSSTITTSVVSETPSETTTATSSIHTNGVAQLAAGSFAMLGGVAMAVLAL
jgi:hypothetical protein